MEFAPEHPVPVFPLPNTVLFPGTVLPLHVFEMRYRTLVRDALSGERLMVLALLKPGWEKDYYGSPDYYPLGCLGRCEEVEWLPDDCYQIKLHGLARVTLGRVAREYPYRAARVSVLPQAPFSEDDPLVQSELFALIESYQRLVRRASGGNQEAQGLAADHGLERMVNAVCVALAIDPAVKQSLLALDDLIERCRQVREIVEERVRWFERRKPGETGEN